MFSLFFPFPLCFIFVQPALFKLPENLNISFCVCIIIVTVKGKTDTSGYLFQGVNCSLIHVRTPKKSVQSIPQAVQIVWVSHWTWRSIVTSVQMVFASVCQLVSIRRTATGVWTVLTSILHLSIRKKKMQLIFQDSRHWIGKYLQNSHI